MINRQQIEDILIKKGFSDYKWISGKEINVAQWVRVKCMFGCGSFGQKSSCPPNVPSVAECREFFSEYKEAVILHFQEHINSSELLSWCSSVNKKLSDLEKEVFLCGSERAFVFFVDECSFCKDCVRGRTDCKNKKFSRPSTEAFAVDVYSTARQAGFPIHVVKNPDEIMNRYAILLIE